MPAKARWRHKILCSITGALGKENAFQGLSEITEVEMYITSVYAYAWCPSESQILIPKESFSTDRCATDTILL